MGTVIEQQRAIDGWTVIHLLAGVWLGAIGVSRPVAYGLILGVEILEFMLRPTTDFFIESPANVIADIAAGVVAYELTAANRERF